MEKAISSKEDEEEDIKEEERMKEKQITLTTIAFRGLYT